MGTDIAEKNFGIECKDLMVKELSQKFLDDRNLFITNFWGLGATDLNNLRSSLKKVSSSYLIVKNSIVKKALKETEMDEITKYIEGGVGIAFGGKNPITTVKTLAAFAKTNSKLNIYTGYMDGEILDNAKIKMLASLPSREELLTKVLSLINSPINNFVNVLAATIRSLINVLNAHKDKLGKKTD